MQYLNNDRKLGLSGLMRVKNDAATLAQSIDSCIDALDELIITYHECTDGSAQIIESKNLQYPDKILVIPYPYHVIGVGATDEEYEYAKTLPVGHPQLLATYYNNALQYVNYKYVMKIDADQIYFSHALKELRDGIVNGVHQNGLARLCGKVVNVFCQKRGNKRIWSKWHLMHWLQYIVVPLFRKQYKTYAVSELLKGDGYLSLSGVNVFRYNDQWYAPLGRMSEGVVGTLRWPYNGAGDHLIFEADEQTEYIPFIYPMLGGAPGEGVLIERFKHPQKEIFLLWFYWFHFRPMKSIENKEFISFFKDNFRTMPPVSRLEKMSFNGLSKYLNINDKYDFNLRNYFGFVHLLGKNEIKNHIELLKGLDYGEAG